MPADGNGDGNGDGTKWCPHCKTHLPRSEFARRKQGSSLLSAYCRKCAALKSAGRRTLEYTMLKNSRRRAERAGIAHSISLDDIRIPDACPVLGIEIDKTVIGKATEASPSLDRIDPGKGYTKDNIAVISLRANRMKSDMRLHEVLKIALWIACRGSSNG